MKSFRHGDTERRGDAATRGQNSLGAGERGGFQEIIIA